MSIRCHLRLPVPVPLLLLALTLALPVAGHEARAQIEAPKHGVLDGSPSTGTRSTMRSARGNAVANQPGPFDLDLDPYRFGHARGRAFLSTMVPLLSGALLFEVGNQVDPDRMGAIEITGSCIAGTGLVVGPSMGLWCSGRSRQAWLGSGVRAAGLGAMAGGMWLGLQEAEDDGLAVFITAPVLAVAFALPGFAMMMLGIRWSFSETPNRRCTASGRAELSVRPTSVRTATRSRPGLRLGLQW